MGLKAGDAVSQTVDLGYVVGPTGPAGPSNLVTVEIDYGTHFNDIAYEGFPACATEKSGSSDDPEPPSGEGPTVFVGVLGVPNSLVPEQYKVVSAYGSDNLWLGFNTKDFVILSASSVSPGEYNDVDVYLTMLQWPPQQINKQYGGTLYLTCVTP